MSHPVAAKPFAAVGVASRLRCLTGLHAWATWSVPRVVDVQWISPAVARQRGWENPQHDTSEGVVMQRQAQERVCLDCGKRQRHYFWPSPEIEQSSLEYGGGGYGRITYRDAVAGGLFGGPPPAGVDFARLDDAVLPMFRNDAWPEPSPLLLACRLGLCHFRRYSPEPRFQWERICPFCSMVFWL